MLAVGQKLYGQSVLEQQVTMPVGDYTLEAVLYYLLDEENIDLFFSNSLLPSDTLSLQGQTLTLKHALDAILLKTSLNYRQVGDQLVLFSDPAKTPAPRYTISGYVRDRRTGERLLAATIYALPTQDWAVSNERGYFSLSLPAGKVKLVCSHLGYRMDTLLIDLRFNLDYEFQLDRGLTLHEVLVTADNDSLLAVPDFRPWNQLDLEGTGNQPALAGTADPLRILQLMPGVQTGADGFGGLSVRGGGDGQNLILIDGVPVYNVYHGAGLFSIIDDNSLKSAQWLKGGFPARYGGRLSSVLDLQTKDGNRNRHEAQIDAGWFTGRFSAEGPMLKGKSSYYISGRRSWLNWYLQPFTDELRADRNQDGQTNYQFFDTQLKLSHSFDPHNQVAFFGYYGGDAFDNQMDSMGNRELVDGGLSQPVRYFRKRSYQEQLQWGNTLAAIQWHNSQTPGLLLSTSLSFSRLEVELDYQQFDSLTVNWPGSYQSERRTINRFQSRIQDVSLKMDAEYTLNGDHRLRGGFLATQHQFRPGVADYDLQSEENWSVFQNQNRPITAYEYALYAEDTYTFRNYFRLEYGLRFSGWLVDNTHQFNVEPRLKLIYEPRSRWSYYFSVSRMAQYLHLLSNSDLGLPTDLWVPTTGETRPETAWQGDLGVRFEPRPGWTLQAEAYYKRLEHLLAYAEGVNFFNNWEENVTVGNGRSLGVEFMLRRQSGRTNGWISYTLARTDRQFELVNLGDRFPFRFDRRHDFKVALQHRFGDRLRVSANWVYGTGLATSLPESSFVVPSSENPTDPTVVINFGSKNQFRLPPNHRLDIALAFDFEPVRNWRHGLELSIYNVYNRQNPIYYRSYPELVVDNGQLLEQLQFEEVSLLPILPSLNYQARF